MNNCQCHEIVVETESPTVELSVEPVNETEKTSFYNLNDQDWLGVVNSEGALIPSTKQMIPIFNGIKNLSGSILYEKFASKQNVVGISFPDLEEATGSVCCQSICSDCKNIEFAYFPKLKNVGNSAFWNAFYGCSALNDLDISRLEVVGDFGMYGFLEGAGFSSENFSFENLKNVGTIGLGNFFVNCSIKNVVFEKLTNADNSAFEGAFFNSGLETISFPNITIGGVTEGGTSFYDMLYGCEDVVAHFPADFEDFSTSWASFIDGFGGENTTILYDINPCYVEINVLRGQNYHIYVNGVEKISPFMTGKSDKPYCIIDSTQYIAYFGVLTGLVVDKTTTFTADLTKANKEIVLNVPSDTTLQVKHGDLIIPLKTVSSGVYSFLTNGSGQEFSYVITESPTTRRTEGTFTIDGSSMSITLTPTPKEWVKYTRPNLTADGTVGGNAFAVWSSGTYSTSSNRQAWCAVNGSTSTSYYWYSKNEVNPIYEFYAPIPIKVASLTFYWTSTSYCAKSFVLDVSNDGSTWTSLGSFTLAITTTAIANINSTNAYKYYRMKFTKQSTYLRLKELEMSATMYG